MTNMQMEEDDHNELKFEDHFSLGVPSSTVRFRGSKVHIYDTGSDQFLLEEVRSDHGRVLRVKRMESAFFGAQVLRLFYTLVALLMLGVCFVVCFQILLFVLISLPANSGLTSNEAYDNAKLVGSIFSIPTFTYGMASLMSLGTTFVTDTWKGSVLFRTVMDLPGIVTELIHFMLFLFFPLIVFVIALLGGSDSAWSITSEVWLWCTLIAFAIFSLMVTYCEVTSCMELVALHNSEEEEKSVLGVMKTCVKLSKLARYSGTRTDQFLVSADEEPASGYVLSPDYEPTKSSTSLYSKFTKLIFLKLDPPVRVFSPEEIRDVLPFMTGSNWSLEGLFMRTNLRFLAATSGESALSTKQVKSSLLFNLLGSFLIVLLLIGVLVWLNVGLALYVLAVIVCIIFCLYPAFQNSRYIYDSFKEVRNPEYERLKSMKGSTSAGGETLFQVRETVRITEPAPWFYTVQTIIDIFLLFLYPLLTFFFTNNTPVGIAFLVVGSLSYIRKYFDVKAILSNLGSLSNLTTEVNADQAKLRKFSVKENTIMNVEERSLISKNRLSQIVGNIRKDASINRWMWVFGSFFFVVLFLFLSATKEDGMDINPGERPPINLLTDFYYPPQPDLPYPTCTISKGFSLPGQDSTPLGDYAFMSALAYEMPNVTQEKLDIWFGPGQVIDESAFVSEYRQKTGSTKIPVSYKLLSVPNIPGFGIVAIRGSETSWDWLVNMQLWSSSALVQAIKWCIPFGWIWHPILAYIVNIVHFIESSSLAEVAYYVETTKFVNDMLETNFDVLQVTGASLGGGLAIITGAQTEANAIAISGLGANYIRHSIIPQVTQEQLDTRVFNFIPQRDIIARIGGRAMLYQEAQCSAPESSLFGCHSMWRSICELSYRCGSGNRPTFCRCVNNFGYPEPIQNGTRTFAEACPSS